MNKESENEKILNELLEAIESSEFRIILAENGFALRKKYYRANNDGRHDRFFVGYESEGSRLSLFYELGGGLSVALGPISLDENSWESTKWVEADHLVSFLLKEPVIRWREKASYSRKENIRMELNSIARRLKPISGQILDLFKDEKTIEKCRADLEEYVREDARSRYNLL